MPNNIRPEMDSNRSNQTHLNILLACNQTNYSVQQKDFH